jgi:hypothetical protein
MTWPLTAEEIAFPTLLPPVAVGYPSISADVPTTVGMTWANYFTGDDGGYAGPVAPVMVPTRSSFGPIALPRGSRGEASPPWGQGYDTDEFQAGPPEMFYPPVTRSYEEAMFMTTERVQPFLAPLPNRSVSGLSGGPGPSWHETPGGALAIGVGAAAVSYFATRAFLKRRARTSARR